MGCLVSEYQHKPLNPNTRLVWSLQTIFFKLSYWGKTGISPSITEPQVQSLIPLLIPGVNLYTRPTLTNTLSLCIEDCQLLVAEYCFPYKLFDALQRIVSLGKLFSSTLWKLLEREILQTSGTINLLCNGCALYVRFKQNHEK